MKEMVRMPLETKICLHHAKTMSTQLQPTGPLQLYLPGIKKLNTGTDR